MLGKVSQNQWDLQHDLMVGWDSVRRETNHITLEDQTPARRHLLSTHHFHECEGYSLIFIHSFTYSLIQQISVEHMLHIGHCLGTGSHQQTSYLSS